jgi:hypothetical protein
LLRRVISESGGWYRRAAMSAKTKMTGTEIGAYFTVDLTRRVVLTTKPLDARISSTSRAAISIQQNDQRQKRKSATRKGDMESGY